MKRIALILASILVVAGLTSSKPKKTTNTNRAEAIAAEIHNPSSKYVIVACHRGDWRNFPENSLSAIESVIRMGADIVEIDVQMTKDSVLVLSHDGNVNRCTNFGSVFGGIKGKSSKIKDLTYAEIQKLSLCRAHGIAIDTMRMPTLRQALACTKDRICVNVDKGYDYYDQVMAIANELGVTDQILIKSSNSIDVVAKHEAPYSHNMMYMPVCNIQSEGGLKLFNSYFDKGIVPLAYEITWNNNDDSSFTDACKKIKAQGSKIWIDTIWASLCGGDGNDDDAAYQATDPGTVYQQYLDNGVSMIQTDHPEYLINWLNKQHRHTLK